jgi:asparagine synthase (glutamine-hydrolysing)
MCGIFSIINNNNPNLSVLENEFNKGQHRGPENSSISLVSINTIFGFHRLAINGLDDISNQPIIINNIVLICNGEIYNYKELYKLMNIVPTTNSDCEVIIHLYSKYGIQQTLTMLDGVFAFVLCDNNINTDTTENIYIARDPYGVRPLYKCTLNEMFGVASEVKMLNNLSTDMVVEHFEPGTFMKFTLDMINPKWISTYQHVKYHIPSISTLLYNNNENIIYQGIQYYLKNAVKKRYINTDRPIACLLSGGLDSSLITALVNEEHNKTNNVLSKNRLETYSIGLVGSDDLLNARIVADYLGTNHTEIIITEQDICDIIKEVIYNIESYDTTTIRASICNYLLGKYIKNNSDAKVIFNGDGSDELCGGYLYMDACPDPIEFDKETRRLLNDIHRYDVLRSDKCISSHGLEPRTPFLDKAFVDFYLSIPCELRFNSHKKIEKYLLRKSFSNSQFRNYLQKPLLPDNILWRKKEAFSDGVSKHNRSLFVIVQEFIASKYNASTTPSVELEKKYYKEVFDESYPNTNILSYLWLPRYTLSTDPSARTLHNYVKKEFDMDLLNEDHSINYNAY